MNVSYAWLKSFVDFDLDPRALRDLLTQRVVTVDEVLPLRADLAPIVSITPSTNTLFAMPPVVAGVAAAGDTPPLATLRYQFPYVERGGGRPDPQPVLLATVRSAVRAARWLDNGPKWLALLGAADAIQGQVPRLWPGAAPRRLACRSADTRFGDSQDDPRRARSHQGAWASAQADANVRSSDTPVLQQPPRRLEGPALCLLALELREPCLSRYRQQADRRN